MTRGEKLGLGLIGVSTALVVKAYVDYKREEKRVRKERILAMQNIIKTTDQFLIDLKFDSIISKENFD